jgi:hypothetical protein
MADIKLQIKKAKGANLQLLPQQSLARHARARAA